MTCDLNIKNFKHKRLKYENNSVYNNNNYYNNIIFNSIILYEHILVQIFGLNLISPKEKNLCKGLEGLINKTFPFINNLLLSVMSVISITIMAIEESL